MRLLTTIWIAQSSRWFSRCRQSKNLRELYSEHNYGTTLPDKGADAMQTFQNNRQDSQTSHPDRKSRMFPVDHRLLFALVIVLFFLWGMSNNLTDILVQQFKKSFELTQLTAQLVQTANFLGYLCMAIPGAMLMRGRGYKE